MDTIRIRSCFTQDVTVISNDFLDRFLPESNGDFLKIYLYLLRTAGTRTEAITLSGIADRMNCTETDVDRALRYWEKEGVLSLVRNDAGGLDEIAFTGYCRTDSGETSHPGSSSELTTERMTELGEREDVRELLFIAQQYLGRPLTRTEMQKICFFYDGLRFSPDLIDYLIEYCVSRGHKSFHYIEKVALNWKEQGISTVRDARIEAGSYHREYYDILKALGIDNHHPVEAEIKIMKKWLERYEFSMELIREACTRTVMGASRPTLTYADGILSKWYGQGVRSLQDVKVLDEEHARKKTRPEAKTPSGNGSSKRGARNSFSEFEQRDYNYSELETQLLKQQAARS